MLAPRGFLVLLWILFCPSQALAYSAMTNAIAKHNLKKVEQLIKNGEDINARHDGMGLTALYQASMYGDLDIATYLLKHGADVNGRSGNEETPLYAAASHGSLRTAELLLAHGADTNTPNKYGDTPLHAAVNNGHLAVARLLLEHGANVNAGNKYGDTPLHFAAESSYASTEQDVVEFLELLLTAGANINSLGQAGSSPLSRIISTGFSNAIAYLIDHGADVNAADKTGYTVLHKACRYKPENVRLLIQHGATVNVHWKNWTPLDLLEQYHPEAREVIALLKQGS